MRNYAIILIPILLWSITGCESPTGGFERTNSNDPYSDLFEVTAIVGLQATADTSGVITILWPESEKIATKNVLEKSLGDSLNFQPIAELAPHIQQFSDTSGDVRKITYYRLSSYVEVAGKEDALLGRSQALLDFGKIINLTYEFSGKENNLSLSWNTDVPFYTHFIITSENILSHKQETGVKITANGIEHFFIDPLIDIDFTTRNYSITGIIDRDGIDEVIMEEMIQFDAKSFFQPANVVINVLNEQDWEISWDPAPFFATRVEVTRFLHLQEITYSLPMDANTLTDSLIVLTPPINFIYNNDRRYEVRFTTDNEESHGITVEAKIQIPAPKIITPDVRQDDPTSFTLSWEVDGNDTDLIKEFIIESSDQPAAGGFVEVARVDGNTYNYSFTNMNASNNYLFRVRTITSSRSSTVRYSYTLTNVYDVEYSFDTGMNYVTTMDVSADKRYLAAVSFRSGTGNSILIADIVAGHQVAEINIQSQQISDLKISPDQGFIYFSVPTEGAIYRADFPDGNNVIKIINDASFNSGGVFRIDISSDGSFLTGLGRQAFVIRWNLDTLERVFEYSDPSVPTLYSYKNIAISPDGNYIVGNDGKTYILDARNGTVLNTLPQVSPNLQDIKFSADGNYFSFVINFSTIHIHRTFNWIRVREITDARRADYHSDKPQMLILRNNGIYFYDMITFSFLERIQNEYGHGPRPAEQNAIKLIDDTIVATVDGTSTVQIWQKKERLGWKLVF